MLINPTSSDLKLAIGLMSGTSLDGIDASLVRTDGKEVIEELSHLYLPYSGEFIKQLRDILFSDTVSISRLAELQYSLTLRHIDAVQDLLQQSEYSLEAVDIIGMHGQTLYHAPELATSMQLGLPDLLAQKASCPVIFNFRNRDVAKGGQGAPLVPLFHYALLKSHNRSDVAILNIGGIANITICIGDQLVASDIGPGNQLINDLCAQHFDLDYDHGGQIAEKHAHDQTVIDQILADDFFSNHLPKSLDRSYFNKYKDYFLPLSPGVAVSTATQLTAQSILDFVNKLPEFPEVIYLSGGGAKNKYLVSALQSLLSEVTNIETISAVGYDADFIESSAFAYLAVRRLCELPSTLPSTTGVSAATIAGDVVYP